MNKKSANLTAGTRKAQRSGSAARPNDQRIHDELYSAIIDHRVAPGTPLHEHALASAFGVSRTIIRKVLQQLSHERLVQIVPNKGATVSRPSADEAKEVFAARRSLERILVERCIATAGDVELQGLIKLAKSEQLAAEKGNKQERVRLSGEFHRHLATISGNSILAGFLGDLVSRTSLIIALYESPGAVPCSHNEHLEIANAIIKRDLPRAIQFMDHHLQHVEAQVDLSGTFEAVDFKNLFKPVK